MTEETKEKSINAETFVKLSDLDKEMYLKLDVINVALIDQYFKKTNSHRYLIKFQLHDLVIPEIFISKDRFIEIVLAKGLSLVDERGRDKRDHVIPVRCRYVRGSSINGDYKSVQLVFKQFLYEVYFFNGSIRNNLETLEARGEIKIDWVDSPEKIDNPITQNFKDEF
jgi:hypothetical protein